jgi:hypothetical protein
VGLFWRPSYRYDMKIDPSAKNVLSAKYLQQNNCRTRAILTVGKREQLMMFGRNAPTRLEIHATCNVNVYRTPPEVVFLKFGGIRGEKVFSDER